MNKRCLLPKSDDRKPRHSVLGFAILLAAMIGCSKSDSDRSAGSDGNDANRSSIADQDEGAIAPENLAGSFLTGVQECRAFVERALLKVGCSFIDEKSGQRILIDYASFVRKALWTISINGRVLSETANDTSTGLNLVSGYDHVWIVGQDGIPWPTRIEPMLLLTLKDGRSIQNGTLSASTIAALKAPPTGSKTAAGSGVAGGNSGSGAKDSFGPDQAIAFATSQLLPAPQMLLTDARVAQTFQSCQAYQQAARGGFVNAQQKLLVSVDVVCRCAAERSSHQALRDRASNAFALIRVEDQITAFMMKMAAKQAMSLYDLHGNKVANASQLLTYNTVLMKIDLNMQYGISFDENARTLTDLGASQYAWTGLDLAAPLDGGQGLPSANCNNWSPTSMTPNSIVGWIGLNDANAFSSAARLSCDTDLARYYCAANP